MFGTRYQTPAWGIKARGVPNIHSNAADPHFFFCKTSMLIDLKKQRVF
jgi:hypothetical protein